MRLDITMTDNDEQKKLHINSWWATCPEFAMSILARQLAAAKVLWPHDLARYGIYEETKSELPKTETSSSDTGGSGS